jgi:hypothetical protein
MASASPFVSCGITLSDGGQAERAARAVRFEPAVVGAGAAPAPTKAERSEA